ncbi:MAG: DUF3417 domain-containing protein [Candidatus Sulfotelmatobacter sp.]|jgi:starch phosphorylase
MTDQNRPNSELAGFDSLAELALDLRWSWNRAADRVWMTLDPTLWELTQNPWVVLQTVSRNQIERVLANPAFRKSIDELLQAKHQAVETPADQDWLEAEREIRTDDAKAAAKTEA